MRLLYKSCPQFTVFLSIFGRDSTYAILHAVIYSNPKLNYHNQGLAYRVTDECLRELEYIPDRFHFDYDRMLNEIDHHFSFRCRTYFPDIVRAIWVETQWDIVKDRNILEELCRLAIPVKTKTLALERICFQLKHPAGNDWKLVAKRFARKLKQLPDDGLGSDDERMEYIKQLIASDGAAAPGSQRQQYLSGLLKELTDNITNTCTLLKQAQGKITQLTQEEENRLKHINEASPYTTINPLVTTTQHGMWRDYHYTLRDPIVNCYPVRLDDGAALLTNGATSTATPVDVNYSPAVSVTHPLFPQATVLYNSIDIDSLSEPLKTRVAGAIWERYDPTMTGEMPAYNPVMAIELIPDPITGRVRVRLDGNEVAVFGNMADAYAALHLEEHNRT